MKAIGTMPRRTAFGAVLGVFALASSACATESASEKTEAPKSAAPARLTSAATTPEKDPWFLTGSRAPDYEISAAPDPSEPGRQLRTLRHVAPTAAEGFGTLMQMFSAEKYRGKRVRFSASVETKGVTSWAGLWMRVDANHSMKSFDNMEGRPIKGTTAKSRHEVVLDVAEDATAIALGVLIDGPGEATLSSPSIEIVDASVPVTGRPPKELGDFQP